MTTVTHAPVITAIDSKYVNEDDSISGIGFSVTDEDAGDTAAITVSSSNTTLLPVDADHVTVTNLGNGDYSLALVPVADRFGSAVVTVTVTDSTSPDG